MAAEPRRRSPLLIFGMAVFFCFAHPQLARAGLLDGLGDILSGVVALPMGILQGTLAGPPVLGTVAGALNGSLHTLGYATRGVYRVASGTLPLVGRLVPFLPLAL